MKAILAMLLLFQATKPGRVIYFNNSSDSFFATGKWASTSSEPKDQIAFDQEVQIDCFRQWKQCVEATAEVYMGHPHITTAYLDVIQWDRNGLIAVSDSGVCMTNKIIVTF